MRQRPKDHIDSPTPFVHRFTKIERGFRSSLEKVEPTTELVEFRARVLSALDCPSIFVPLPGGGFGIAQDYLETDVTASESRKALKKLDIAPASAGETNQFIFEMDSSFVFLSDLKPNNFGRRKNGEVVPFDLIATKIPESLKYQMVDSVKLTTGNSSSL